ncbi:hypothetical protein F5883DRAFT_556571 [Diaporthe sp. PMI_573]|nr:hypothetical protein F5883DRAFT_556571 [Diaporthaceae sp. PMI_573]
MFGEHDRLYSITLLLCVWVACRSWVHMGGTWWLEDVLLLMSMLELCPLVLFLHFEHVLEPPARRHQVGGFL